MWLGLRDIDNNETNLFMGELTYQDGAFNTRLHPHQDLSHPDWIEKNRKPKTRVSE